MSSPKKKQQVTITRSTLTQDVEQFLKNGGTIDRIKSGISGQTLSKGVKTPNNNANNNTIRK